MRDEGWLRSSWEALVEAFRRVPTDAWLVVAGGRTNWIPGETGRLETAVASLPEAVRRRVRFTGYVSEDDKRALLAGAEVLVAEAKLAREFWHKGESDEAVARRMIERHARFTGSAQAKRVLANWGKLRAKFVKVFPNEYRRALGELAAKHGLARRGKAA